MAKSNKDHATALLEMATKDHKALANMLDASRFSEEVFGFHAQQVVEKALKAWLAARGLAYPKSHDVSVLKRLLQDAGQDLGPFPDLEDYTVFAVQYRYEAYDEGDELLDRPHVVQNTATVVEHVRGIIAASTW